MPTKDQIELEAAQVRLENERMQLEKTKYEVSKFHNDKANRESNLKTRGAELKMQTVSRRNHQAKCNHREGGKGLKALQSGQGQDTNYSVSKHKLPTGDVMVRCSRCRKTWIPPLESDYVVNGKLDRAALKAAQDEYLVAYNFPTRYETGSSNQLSWQRDGKPINREKTHIFAQGAKECAL